MKHKSAFLVLTMIYMLIGLFALSRLPLRPTLPFQWKYASGRIEIIESEKMPPEIQAGDRLLRLDDLPVKTPPEIEYFTDHKKTGDLVQVTIQRNDQTILSSITLRQRADLLFMAINCLLGLSFIFVALFVYLKKSEDDSARIFSWAFLHVGLTIMMVWSGYAYSRHPYEYGLIAVYYILYPLVPAWILHFCLIYPNPVIGIHQRRWIQWALYLPGLLFSGLLSTSYIFSTAKNSLVIFRLFFSINNAFRIYFMLYFLIGIFSLVNAYRKSDTLKTKQKIKWIFWGITVGTFPFLFLWSLPYVIGLPRIPDTVNYLFIMLVPISFAISIIRYQTLDIQVVIQKSIVYTMVSGIIVMLYLFFIGVAGYLFQFTILKQINAYTICIMLVAAILFNPIKNQVQTWVDKTFYRTRHNYHLAIEEIIHLTTSAVNPNRLSNRILDMVESLIPVEQSILIFLNDETGHFKIMASHQTDDKITTWIQSERQDLNQICTHIETRQKNGALIDIFPEIVILSERHPLHKSGFTLLIPGLVQSKMRGCLVMGPKKSGLKYTKEDYELLMPITRECFQALERFHVHEGMVLERAEKQKHETMSKLKSDFISHISHEMRTPITAVQWSIENLLDGIPEKPGPKIMHYLEGIHQNIRHLGHMIENILDTSRIEAGRLEIRKETLNLDDEIHYILRRLAPLAEKKHIQINIHGSDGLACNADRDGLHTILNNLLDNAIKYSPEHSIIVIDRHKIEKEHPGIRIGVNDQGPGIPKEKQKVIFQQFERLQDNESVRVKGMGLGLYIVYQLVRLHHGDIVQYNLPDAGSRFEVDLPAG